MPKTLRQVLGVDYGDKVAFDLHGSQVIISRVDQAPHEDPAIGAFMALLEADIRSGQHLCSLPDDLVQAMVATLKQPVNLGT